MSTFFPQNYSAFNSIASSLNTPRGLESMITAARASEYWQTLIDALHLAAVAVGSDLVSIWRTLETGRLEWLKSLNSAHPLKVILKDALKSDDQRTEKDEVDAKMIWMYALTLSIPTLSEVSKRWSKVVQMENMMNPLQNYKVDLWDCRKDEWRSLDLGVQEAAVSTHMPLLAFVSLYYVMDYNIFELTRITCSNEVGRPLTMLGMHDIKMMVNNIKSLKYCKSFGS